MAKTGMFVSLAGLRWMAALLAALMTPTVAVSQLGAGCRCGAISGFHAQTRRHVTAETADAADRVVRALQGHAQQTSSHLDRQVEAERRIADGEAQNRAKLARSVIRAEAESGRHDPNSDFCLLVDTALEPALPDAEQFSGMREVSGAVGEWSSGRVEPVRENGVRMAAWLAEQRVRLQDAGDAQDATTDWQFALERLTLPLEDSGYREALSRLVSNTIDPFPPRPLSETDLKTPAGLAEAVRRASAESRNRAAVAAIASVLELAEPTHPAEAYRTIADQSRRGQDLPDVLSELQALDVRVSAYDAPTAEALERRHSKTERALLQDLIDLQSLNARISQLKLAQELRTSVVLAAILGTLTDGAVSNLIPQ